MLQNKKRIISLILMLTLLVGTLVVGAISASAEDTPVATFEFGANGSASHSDGNTTEIKTYNEKSGEYTIEFSNLSKVYQSARDEKGNSCLKLGSGSAAGKFSFTVPKDVTSVVIYIAKYKANTTKITVNGTAYTLTKSSNDGAYDEIVVDTTSTKTVDLTTVSGGYRAMVNKIEYFVAASTDPDVPECEHDWDNDCDTECNLGCGETREIEHDYSSSETKAATCTETGVMTYTCTVCGDSYPEDIPTTSHNYVDGVCTVCNAKKPVTLTFDDTSKRTTFNTSKQVWEENGIILTNNKSSSTSNVADNSNPARFYASSEIIVSVANGSIKEIVFDCNTTSYATALKESIETGSGATVTVSSDKVTVTFDPAVESFKVAKLSAQVRMDSLTVTLTSAGGGTDTPECEHVKEKMAYHDAKEATCTGDGNVEYWQCENCQKYFNEDGKELDYNDDVVTPQIAHNTINGKCESCNKFVAVKVTDISSIGACSKIIIVATGYDYALSTQNTNNRGQADVTKNGDTVTFGDDDDVQIITLAAGNVNDTFAFNVGSGYLYAASSSANHLKTQTTNNENGSWKIEISEAGVATITAKGTYTRNWLRYNNSDSLFSCYFSGQKDISIYALEGGERMHTEGCGHAAEVGDDLYTSIKDAIDNVESGTITLVNDVTYEGTLELTNGNVVIDLNGHNLTATGGIVTFGYGEQLIDSGATKGLILVGHGNLIYNNVSENGSFVPVWNGEGYVLADVVDQYKGSTSAEDNKTVVEFRPAFVGIDHFTEFADGVEDNDLTFKVRVTVSEKDVREYEVPPEVIMAAYTHKYTIRVTLVNANLGETYKIELVIEYAKGVTYVGDLGSIAEGVYSK